MFVFFVKKRTAFPFRFLAGVVLVAFISTSPGISYAQLILDLPTPGAMVGLTPPFAPPLMKGLTIHPENPLQFDFLIDPGDVDFRAGSGHDKADEYRRLIKYFLAALTVPEEDLWVNLSPYEKDHIIPENFGKTEMGRDLLGQDYILKQLTASLMYPEKELGKEFWDKVYKQARQRFGTTEIPVNTFNKVWIVADKASVYEHGNTVFLVDSHLKVMLEEDYLAASHQSSVISHQNENLTTEDRRLTTQIIKEIILPAIEKEVNEGKNFALLRQINNSLILAVWYKTTLKESLLGKVYADRSKTDGVDQDIANNQKIYEQYLEAFKKGVYNYIKEDYDPITQEMIPRKYFSGGYRVVDPSLDNLATPQNEGFLNARIYKLTLRGNAPAILTAIAKAGGLDEAETNFKESGGPASIEEQSGSAASPVVEKTKTKLTEGEFKRLLDLLKSGNENSVWESINALGETRDPKAIPALMDVIRKDKSETGSVRIRAARIIGEIGGPEAISALKDVLKEYDSDDDSVLNAIDTLGKTRDPQAIPVLQKRMMDRREGVRVRAVQAIGEIGGPEVVSFLGHILLNPWEYFYYYSKVSFLRAAIYALGEIGGPEAILPLTKLLNFDGDGETKGVRPIAAARALGRIGDRKAIPALNEVLKRELEHGRALGLKTELAETIEEAIRGIESRKKFAASPVTAEEEYNYYLSLALFNP